jgi:hypothetical protein
MSNDVAELIARYRAAADGTGDLGSKRQNASADAVHACYKTRILTFGFGQLLMLWNGRRRLHDQCWKHFVIKVDFQSVSRQR